MEPKVFISYSWSDPCHKNRVQHWAERLVADGINVVLDIYDLKEGNDKYVFMERMVTDTSISHVLVICDRQYMKKADGREFGVGTEAQIISQEVYEKVGQSKFIPIVCELDIEGKPYLPAVFRSRIWIDFSTPDKENKNWEQLIRLLYDKPKYIKPVLGKAPKYIINRDNGNGKKWHWGSSVESVENSEFSMLAISESIMASAISLWAAWSFHSINHIVISVMLAPFLLLKTEMSCSKALSYFGGLLCYIEKKEKIISPFLVILVIAYVSMDTPEVFYILFLISLVCGVLWVIKKIYYLLENNIYSFLISTNITRLSVIIVLAFSMLYAFVISGNFYNSLKIMLIFFIVFTMFWGIRKIPKNKDKNDFSPEMEEGIGGRGPFFLILGSLLVKVYVGVINFTLHPIESIKIIPSNWYKTVLCVDMLRPPELLPEIENVSVNNIVRKYKFSVWRRSIKKDFNKNGGHKIVALIAFVISLIIFVPALMYRWSLKSSCIIWLPLIFVIGGWKKKVKNIENLYLQDQLKAICETSLAKIQFYYAFITIFVLTLMPIYFKGQINFVSENVLYNELALKNIVTYFFALQMDAWHWSRLASALLTLAMYFYAERLLLKRQFFDHAGLYFAPYFLRSLTLLRLPLSLFTIGCGLYLIISPINWSEQFENMEWLPFKYSEFIVKK